MFGYLQKIWSNYLNTGLAEFSDNEDIRKVHLLNSMTLVGFSFIVIFGVHSLFTNDISHGTVLLSISLALIINYLYLKIYRSYKVPLYVVLSLMSILLVFLLLSGGVGNSGILWYYVYPPLVLFLVGAKVGSTMVLSLFSLTGLLLFYPGGELMKATYSIAFKIRFLTSFLAVFLLTLFYEASRFKSQSSLTRLSKRYAKLAHTDTLTGILNRRGMLPLLQAQYAYAESAEIPFSILIVDIDHFKRVNDSFGHLCGDHVLKNVAQTIMEHIRQYDRVCRWGGEEFLVLLPNTLNDGAARVAEKLRVAINHKQIEYENQQIEVSISIGGSGYQEVPNIDDIIKKADQNLYQAKADGRNKAIVM